MCDYLTFINSTEKTLKSSKKCFNFQDEKKPHTRKFQLKGIDRNMRCKLLLKRSTGKTTECSKRHITIEKIFFQNLTDAFFKYL